MISKTEVRARYSKHGIRASRTTKRGAKAAMRSAKAVKKAAVLGAVAVVALAQSFWHDMTS